MLGKRAEPSSTAICNVAIDKIPRHVAIIMDGNGRWAQQKGKLRTFGHKAGVDAVRSSVRLARKLGVESLTLFAFSSENWQRPKEEVGVLMQLFSMVLKSEVKKLNKNNIRLKVIGDLSAFDSSLQEKINKAEALTEKNTALTLNIAANYGGRWDIVDATKRIAQKLANNEIDVHDINEDLFNQHVSTSQLPELDLLIRTGGDHRVSNFLLWQCAYAEFYFTETLWPDFSEEMFALAIQDFANRQRRFGLTGAQIMTQDAGTS
ncbi:polyprenyl diphosphate synthase [Glaciecola sp. 2405UD65-10]|uniref:polyprenyl diphosphate synthase n=1 Tax=Glaciecola sp. 2405UD65-10 TaxID=3397244 RepID=UPI003B597077